MKKKTRSMNSSLSSTPFADLTNNLTPFSSLVKLCNSTNLHNSKVPFDASPLSGNENRNPVGDKADVDLRDELPTPSRRVASPPTPPLGEGGSGEHSYNGRWSEVKSKDAIYRLSDSVLVEKDSRKEIRIPSSCPVTLETVLDKNLGTVVPSFQIRSCLRAKRNDKGKAIAVSPTRSAPLKTNNDKGKAIAVTPTRPIPLKTVNNKGIAFLTPLDDTRSMDMEISSPSDKLKDKDILVGNRSVTSGSCHLQRYRGKQMGNSVSSRHSIILNELKGKVKKTAALFNRPLETKNKDALLTPINLCSKKADHKGPSLAMASDCQPPFRPNDNFVKQMEMFTCPPLPRTRSSRKRNSKYEHNEPPKSWTDPHPKKPKTRRIKKEADELDFLPKEFVEKHRAYFKEVDEFELAEEEISDDEIDKE